jgi:hypothetical protein
MKKQSVKPVPAKEQFPELQMLAEVIAQNIAIEINHTIDDNIDLVRTDCPYPKQCLLELTIAELEKRV